MLTRLGGRIIGQEALRPMGYDTETARRLRAFFSGRADVTEKKMVGGLSFMVVDHMCCGVTSAGLMVRVGPDAREQALAEPHVQPMTFAGRSLGGYVCVRPAGYQDDDALAGWIQRGIDFVATLPARQATMMNRSQADPEIMHPDS